MPTEIYKLDTKGKTRIWSQEREGSRYRTNAGILGGTMVTSGWTECIGKQGRNDYEQAAFEVAANYQNKLTREYHSSLDDIGGGAHFFKPMLAQTYEAAKFQRGYGQAKLDGMRCIATKDGLFSRQGKPIVSVPHISNALKHTFKVHPDLVIDGEIYSHELREDFGQLMSLARQTKPTAEDLAKSATLEYHVYDLPTGSDFSERLDLMEFLIVPSTGPIKLVPTQAIGTPDDYDDFHAECLAAGYEGSVFRLDQPYEQKRSKSLLKRKEFLTEEFPIFSIDAGLGNWSGVAKSVTCRLPDGRTFGAGIKGTKERAASLLGESWDQATIRFFEYTPDGVPRFPVVIDFHNGRTD